ncbi:MAG TPA: hypothetical protein VKZ94_03655 [Advenella sp.]|nr:hypothetical protein [Advenella sp.]
MKVSDKLDDKQQLSLWTALAQMFVTNDLGVFHLKRLAQQIVDAIGNALTIQEIESVLVNEVGPNFMLNFSPFMFVPEDLGWEKKDVERIMTKVGLVDRGWRYLMHRNALKNPVIIYRWAAVKTYLADLGVSES